MRPDAAPAEGVNPFIMNLEGVVRLSAVGRMAEGCSPSTTSRSRRPIDTNLLHPKVVQNPGAVVQRRRRAAWHVQGLPVRGDHLPPDRAHALLEQEYRAQRHYAAGVVCRDRRGAGEGEGHCQRLPGQGAFEARRDQGRGRGHWAHAGAGQRQEGAHGRYSDPLGFIGCGEEGSSRQHAHPFVGDAATSRRRSSRRSGLTSRRHRGRHGYPSNGSNPAFHIGQCPARAPATKVAKLIDISMHRLQAPPGGVHGMGTMCAMRSAPMWGSTTIRGSYLRLLHGDAFLRSGVSRPASSNG